MSGQIKTDINPDNFVMVLTKSNAIKGEERIAKVKAGQNSTKFSTWIFTTGMFFIAAIPPGVCFVRAVRGYWVQLLGTTAW